MKVFGIWVFTLFLLGTCLLVLSFPVNEGMAFPPDSDGVTAASSQKSKKGNVYDPSNEKSRNVVLEDYHPVDPAPSSKASIKPGPIDHGAPLLPFIPGPPPSSNP